MRKLVDKTIRPLTTVANLSPSQAVSGLSAGSIGNLPIGYYKGSPAFWDLDLANVQPLVNAEKAHILRKLDGRLPTYDSIVLTHALGAVVGDALVGTLVVPANEVWYVDTVEITTIKDATAGYTVNWGCSIWPDNATPANAAGQAYYALDQAGAANTSVVLSHLFGIVPAYATVAAYVAARGTIMPTALRLPPGSIITFTSVVNTAAATAAAANTLNVYGYVGKYMVS
jgi:hypothetical protein